ncbi:MAG: PAS domain-containing protein [Chloroflexaceae bacterium]|nr:PAS domain-containing protein [Chloroflexaceae bacterium]
MSNDATVVHEHTHMLEDVRDEIKLLRQNHSMLRTLFDHIPMAAFVKDRHGRYLMINRYFRERLNREPDLIVGKTDYQLFALEIATPLRVHDERVLTTNKEIDVIEMVPFADGMHSYRSIKFPIYNDQGDIWAIGGISFDMSKV